MKIYLYRKRQDFRPTPAMAESLDDFRYVGFNFFAVRLSIRKTPEDFFRRFVF